METKLNDPDRLTKISVTDGSYVRDDYMETTGLRPHNVPYRRSRTENKKIQRRYIDCHAV